MLEKIITKSTDYLIRNRVIEEDDRDVYEYGFHSLYNNIIDIASILVISIFLHQVPQTALYHVAFIALRATAGGFHAKTHFRCFIFSTAMWLFSLWAISAISLPVLSVILAGASAFLIWLKAPVEHENNPLSAKKRQRMKILSRTIATTLFLAVILVSVLGGAYIWIAASLAYGMASHMILILAALLSKHNKNN